jgi:hypothetical protein
MPSVTPHARAYSSQKAPHMVVKRPLEDRISAAGYGLSMIFSENRFALFRIML